MTTITAGRMADILKGLQARLEEGLPWAEFEEWSASSEKPIRPDWQSMLKAAYDAGYQSALTDAMRRLKDEIGA